MSQSNPKTPKRKGIAKAKKERKHFEAIARNAETPPERTRAYRRRMEGSN